MDLRVGLDGCEKKLATTGIRPPNRPARSESLYRLNYPDPHYVVGLSGNARSWKHFCFSGCRSLGWLFRF